MHFPKKIADYFGAVGRRPGTSWHRFARKPHDDRETLMNAHCFQWLALVLGLALVPATSELRSQETKEPPPPAAKDLKQRLKDLEDQAGKIRAAMLKEIDGEARKLDEALKKAEEDQEKASKAKDRAGAAKARDTAMKLRHSQFQLTITRHDVERRFNIGVPQRVKTPSEEERLGIHTTVPSLTLVNQLGLAREQGTVGMVVDRIVKDSSAAKAGLQVHDVLVQLDGKSVPSDAAKFRKLLSEIKPATPVEVTILRQGKQQTIAGMMIPAAGQQAGAADAAPKSAPVPPSQP
jgi:C-terminal processing protease CtpA/Prc